MLKDGTSRRIRVRQGGECVPLAPAAPTISSAHSPWEGVLLERHRHGPYHVDDHEHPSHFLSLHLSGPAPLRWRANGKEGSNIVGSGSAILLSRGTRDSVSFPKPVERILFTLEPKVFQHGLQEHYTGADVELVDQWGVQDRRIEYILRALEADLDAGSPSGKLFGESLTNALVVHLQRRYAVTLPKTMDLRGGLPSARLKRVQEYIEANLDQEVALSQLAAIAGMSSHYFAELFKQSVGVSPHQYVLRRRIELARKHLRDPHMRILEAGVRSGFSDQSHFTKIFRRMVGVTPSEYRSTL